MSVRRSALLALLLVGAGTAIIVLGIRQLLTGPAPAVTPSAAPPVVADVSPTPHPTEPLLPPPPTSTPVTPATPTEQRPTATPSPPPAPSATGSPPVQITLSPTPPPPSATPSATPTATPTVTPGMTAVAADLRPRLGVGATGIGVDSELASLLGFGWYVNWKAAAGGFQSEQVAYVPMIRLKDGQTTPSGQELLDVIDALPGALWLIGNEPDVEWQDNVTPAKYAQAYHELYHLLKDRDPSCRIAIGGVTQPTPLRLRYLDEILNIYQERYGEPMPVDVWNVHNFILREERDSWGVGIPPGLDDEAGTLREIADHDDMVIFRQQIVAFRQWMADRGFQDKPLIVSEYGILMPSDYGFPIENVEAFMIDTFQFFSEAADPALGYPADGHRLVQRWCWYSLADDFYSTGNLIDRESRQPTRLGEAFSRYARPSP